jgi:diphosphomevalonate decarboxylase
VRELRANGLQVYATMDAGPHVKALCRAADTQAVSHALSQAPGVLRTLQARPGPGVELF